MATAPVISLPARYPRLLPIVCLVLAGLPWFLATTCPFITLDDLAYIRDNPHVTTGLSVANIAWAFNNSDRGLYIPFTWLSLQLDASLFGKSPAGFHLTNVLLHIANTVLLFVFLQRTTRRTAASFVVALLFSVHPLRVESVVWATERKDVLAVFFGLLAMMAYAAYARRPFAGRYLLVLPLYAASLLAKPLLVTLPFLLLLLDFWPLRRAGRASVRKIILEKLPLLALAVAVSALAAYIQSRTNTDLYLAPKPLLERLANVPVSYALYLRDTVFPANLALFYPWNDPTSATRWLPALLLLLAITAVLIAAARRKTALVPALIGWLWFLGTLLPMIGLIQSGNQSRADRFTYFPSIGLFLALAFCWPRTIPPRLTAAVTAVAAFILVIVMLMQLTLWRDPLNLYLASYQRTTDNWFVASFAAEEFQKRNQPAEAVRYYRIVTRLAPFLDQPHNNLAGLLVKAGQLDEALTHLQRAVELAPSNATYRANEQKLRAYLESRNATNPATRVQSPP